MINLEDKIAENARFLQNPVPKFRRNLFPVFLERIKERELITSLVGLRRIGKSTLIRQVIDELLIRGENQKSILYFLFEEKIDKNEDSKAFLKKIIDYQLKRNPEKKSYLFFDEIQYVDGWNDVLKYYFDLYPNLKFIVSGSSSLFVKTRSKESLAGRIQELTMRPMGYGEYLGLTSKENLQEYFFEYLSWGEFPYLEKLTGWEEKREYVTDFVFKKVVENDLPRLKKVYGSEISNMLKVFVEKPCQIVEIQNLARDLGIATNTAREYLNLLEQSQLTSQIYNLGIGFRERSIRQRKIYLNSVNAHVLSNISGLSSELWQHNIGSIVELFVYNHLVRLDKGEIFFFRKRQIKEVDFILKSSDEKLPIEVKYQNQIRDEDLKNILYYCNKEKLKKAMLITKSDMSSRTVDGVKIDFIPANTLLD